MMKFIALTGAFILSVSLSLAAERKAVPSAITTSLLEQKAAESVHDVRIGSGELVDINSASGAQLKAIKGIGAEYSMRIIAGRPYAYLEQLVTKKIVPREVYEAIKDQLIAKAAY